MRVRQAIERRLAELEAANQRRHRVPGPAAGPDGSLGSALDVRLNDYLGLGALPVSRETARALTGVPRGARASRLVGGTGVEQQRLEQDLASWLELDSALAFSSAYAANVGALAALATAGDLIVSDSLNHASIVDGCRLSRARVEVVPHGDLGAIREKLRSGSPGVCWVVVESYYSMDADSPDLGALRELCDRADAALIVDEAHALGVFGAEGRGLCHQAGIRPDLLVGGFGKALGLQGGFAAGEAVLCEWLWNRARSFVFSTGVSPVSCVLAQEHLARVRAAEAPRARLRSLEAALTARLRQGGVVLPSGRHGPIFPVLLGSEARALEAGRALARRGVLAQPIRPPTVPPGGSRLRITLQAAMTGEEVDRLGTCLCDVVSGLGEGPSASCLASPRPTRPERGPGGTDLWGALDAKPECRRFVVLGTGTEVGKTHVSGMLLELLRDRGRAAAGLKPVETGVGERDRDGDARRLEATSFHVKHTSPHPLHAFRDPVTPALAARRAGVLISIDDVAKWVETAASLDFRDEAAWPRGRFDQVIETAGGVFSPITDRETNFELARALDPALWILVVPDRLGVLSEAYAALSSMRAAGRPPDWVVFNAPPRADESTGFNLEELHRHHPHLPMLAVPRGAPAGRLAPLLAAIACQQPGASPTT